MPFLKPARIGTGVGKALVTRGIAEHGVRTVSVNEQNPAALGSSAWLTAEFAIRGCETASVVSTLPGRQRSALRSSRSMLENPLSLRSRQGAWGSGLGVMVRRRLRSRQGAWGSGPCAR